MDGLDPHLLEGWLEELPNFKQLTEEGTFVGINSVYPPDSVPAWASIYTGTLPDEHGILDSIDYLDIAKKHLACDVSGLKGNTFWDIAGNAGKKVCIINPFLAYPVWPVNGIMANGPVFVSGNIQTYPESIMTEYDVPELGGIVDSPTKKDLGPFAEKTWELTLEYLRFSKDLFDREPWDLFFINFLALDRVQHLFWRYQDTDDPTYPGKNPHSDVIKNFYKLHDRIIGEFRSNMDKESLLIVLSDHGHGRRCTKALSVNELLRQKGLLKSSTRAGVFDPKYMLEKVKTSTLRFLAKHDLQDLAFKIGKMVPGAKSLKKSTFVIDRGKSAAQVARFAGMNPFGGIDLPRSEFDGDDHAYDDLTASLIKDLMELKDPKNKKSIVKWAVKREEMFLGRYSHIYPEIIFELESDYGVSRSLFGPLVDINPTHKKISGGHMPEAVFLANQRLKVNAKRKPSILSIAPTVLNFLGVPTPEQMHETPFVKDIETDESEKCTP